jgi:hypothetical protein
VANDGRDDPNRKPTKDERREDARRERKEIEHKMARRKRNRSYVLGALALAVVVAAVAVVLTTQGDNGDAADGSSGPPSGASLLSQAAAAEKTAGCSAVDTTADYDSANVGVDTIPTADGSQPQLDFAHVGEAGGPVSPPALSTYPTIPPASGPHDANPLPHGIYDSAPPIQQAIHSLEHGGAIIWYDPAASGPGLTELLDFYGQDSSQTDVGQDRVIVAPYDYPNEGDAGSLPAGTQMALVAWHRYEACTDVNLAAAFNFTARYASYAAPPADGVTYLGDAREPDGTF